ncbi:MAG TPA: thiosulfate oxidation carrier complex protein SoxZ [Beijerinckiaceae bacterium]|jgi:sulfur-oxidizing protein SoxZ
MAARVLVNVPPTAKRGEVVEIKALIAHPMETGYRVGPEGQMLPRDIITRFSCTYGGVEVFSADLFPALTANPYLAFTTLAVETGDLVFNWEGDNGFLQTHTARLTVA